MTMETVAPAPEEKAVEANKTEPLSLENWEKELMERSKEVQRIVQQQLQTPEAFVDKELEELKKQLQWQPPTEPQRDWFKAERERIEQIPPSKLAAELFGEEAAKKLQEEIQKTFTKDNQDQ